MPLLELRNVIKTLRSTRSLEQQASYLLEKRQVIHDATWSEIKLFGSIELMLDIVTGGDWDTMSPQMQVLPSGFPA